MIREGKTLWVGIGCQRGTSSRLINYALEETFCRYDLNFGGIAGFATIDLKAEEPAILELCSQFCLPLKTFRALELGSIKVPSPSSMVKTRVATPSVAEAAALLAASAYELLVPKQIVTLSGEPGAVTVAVAILCSKQYLKI